MSKSKQGRELEGQPSYAEQLGNVDIRERLRRGISGDLTDYDRARDDLQLFTERVVKVEAGEQAGQLLQLATFQREILQVLADPSKLFVLIIAPRGSAKSTLSISFLAWAIGRSKNTRAILASNIIDVAKTGLVRWEALLRDNDYQKVFGNLIPDTRRVVWNAEEKHIFGKTAPHPSLLAAGTDSARVLGKRADILVLDDVLDSNTAASAAESARLEDWVWRTLRYTLEPKTGRMIWLGTRWAHGDHYARIPERLKGYGDAFVELEYKALLDEVDEQGDKRYWSLWPERWPVEWLLREQEANYFEFRSSYQGDPVDMSKSTLRVDWLKVVDEDKLPTDLQYYQGIDPSNLTGKTTSDNFALATVAYSPSTSLCYLVDLYCSRPTLDELRTIIEANLITYSPKVLTIETQAAQMWFKRYLQGTITPKLLEAVYIRDSNAIPQKEARIHNMARHFIPPKVVLVGSHGKARPRLQTFISEWEVFPLGKHDDSLDAVDKALEPIVSSIAEIAIGGSDISPLSAADVNPSRRDGGLSWQDGGGMEQRPGWFRYGQPSPTIFTRRQSS